MKRNANRLINCLIAFTGASVILATLSAELDAQIFRRDRPVLGRVVEQVREAVRENLPLPNGRPAAGQVPAAPKPLEANRSARNPGTSGSGILRAATAEETSQSQSATYSQHARFSPNQSVLAPPAKPNRRAVRSQPSAQRPSAQLPDPSAIYFDPRTGQYFYRSVPQATARSTPPYSPTDLTRPNAPLAETKASSLLQVPAMAKTNPAPTTPVDPYQNAETIEPPATDAAFELQPPLEPETDPESALHSVLEQ